MARTVIAAWFLGVVEQLSQHGIPPERLRPWSNGLERLAPTRQLKHIHIRQLWHRAMQENRDPLLGLKVGGALPLQAMNILAMLLGHSSNIEEALAMTVRFHGLVSSNGRFYLAKAGGGSKLVYEPAPCAIPIHAGHVDCVIGAYLSMLRRCAPAQAMPYRIALPGVTGASRADYEALLGTEVVLGKSQANLFFSPAALSLSWPASDAALFRLARSRAEAMLQAQGRSHALVDHVLAAIADHDFANASCEKIARALDLSTRTLQRRLAKEKTSFRELLETARMDEAVQLLADPELTIASLAHRLGYAEPSAFSHAVRAHFGLSPRSLRAELAKAAAAPPVRRRERKI